MSRILLIEDDTGAQLLGRNRLTELGYEVVVAPTGARGLMEARASAFDLFLVDITLGSGIDGFEVCRRLKAVPEIRRVPVVLISSTGKSREELHRGYEAGCQAFLVKGDLVLLEDVVRAHLQAKAAMDELAMQNRLLEEQNRRLDAERARGADPSSAPVPRAAVPARELEGILLVDGEGAVRATDRGARELFGVAAVGKHLASLAPDTRLEARVRNARPDAQESVRFDLPERTGRKARPLVAGVHPLVAVGDRSLPSMTVLVLSDAGRLPLSATGTTGSGEGGPAEYRSLLLDAARAAYRPESVLGSSPAIRALRARLPEIAASDGTVLVGGPAGVGKEFLARVLHFSRPHGGPFVSVACGVGAGTIERELFGQAAVPPEVVGLPGALELARGGTLFLRDVERLPPPLQERLRAGLASFPRSSAGDAPRVVAGTSVELQRLVELGRFQPELAEALSSISLTLPPLRERPADVALLARAFLALCAGPDASFAPEVEEVLARHAWPENVRELRELVSRACAAAKGDVIGLGDLPPSLAEDARRPPAAEVPGLVREETGRARYEREYRALTQADGAVLLDGYERCALLHALYLTDGDKLKAARLLGLGKSTLYRKLKQHAIT